MVLRLDSRGHSRVERERVALRMLGMLGILRMVRMLRMLIVLVMLIILQVLGGVEGELGVMLLLLERRLKLVLLMMLLRLCLMSLRLLRQLYRRRNRDIVLIDYLYVPNTRTADTVVVADTSSLREVDCFPTTILPSEPN